MGNRRVSNSRTMKRGLLIAPVLALLAAPANSTAQERWPVTIEAYVGGTRGHSDNVERYRGSQHGWWADLLVGARLHSPERSGAFVALAATSYAVNSVQTLDCPPAPAGGCVPYFPGFGSTSLLAGWESHSTNVRVLAGPSVVSSDHDVTAGFVGRFDLALPLAGRISAAASLGTLVVPSWNRDLFVQTSFGIGLRLR